MMGVKRKHEVEASGEHTKRFSQREKKQKTLAENTPTASKKVLPSPKQKPNKIHKNRQFKKKGLKAEVRKAKSANDFSKSESETLQTSKIEPLKLDIHKAPRQHGQSEHKEKDKEANSERKLKPWKRWQKIKKLNKKQSAGNEKTISLGQHKQIDKDNANVITKKSLRPEQHKQIDKDNANVITKKSLQPGQVSCNWKKLKTNLQQSDTRRNSKTRISRHQKISHKEETKSVEPEIWFDDVDEELIKTTNPAGGSTKKTSAETSARGAKSETTLVKEYAYKGTTRAVALDCEMVGVGDAGRESVLARVSVVNQYGECLYDTFVKSREDVVDYRTQWSGVTPDKLQADAVDFLDAQQAVSDLIRGRILVGHAIHNDLKVLFLAHPRKDIRDTSRYKPYRQMFKGRTPSLKNLTSRLLNVKIQSGEHNSVTDAQAAMRLYTLSRQDWEKQRRKKSTMKKKPVKVKTKE